MVADELAKMASTSEESWSELREPPESVIRLMDRGG